MKILVCGPYFRDNDGNISLHAAEVGVVEGLKQLGHEISVYDPRNNIFMFPVSNNLSKGIEDFNFNVDIALSLGCGANPKLFNTTFWKETSSIKVNWNSEPVRLPDYRSKIEGQKDRFDKFFTFDESELGIYHKLGIENVKWLPQAYNPEWYAPLGIEPSFDICFVGSTNAKWINRNYLLDRIAKSFKINVASIFDAKKVNKIYNSHKLVLNLGLYCPEAGHPSELKGFSLQQRQFESVGAGSVVVSNEIPVDTNQIFIDKSDMLFYNKDNLEEVIRYGLENWKQMRESVIKIREEHSYKARMKQMIEML